MYSTSSGRGFLPLVTAAHEITPTCSCMRDPVVIYTSVVDRDTCSYDATHVQKQGPNMALVEKDYLKVLGRLGLTRS